METCKRCGKSVIRTTGFLCPSCRGARGVADVIEHRENRQMWTPSPQYVAAEKYILEANFARLTEGLMHELTDEEYNLAVSLCDQIYVSEEYMQ